MIECFGVNSCVSGLNIAPAFKIFGSLHPFSKGTPWELNNDTTRVSTCPILQTEQSYYCMTLISIMAHSRQPTVVALGEMWTVKESACREKRSVCLLLQWSFVLNHESILHCYSSVPCSRLLSLLLASLSRLCSNIRICMQQSIALDQSIFLGWESILITKGYSDHLITRAGPSAQCYHRRKYMKLSPFVLDKLQIQVLQIQTDWWSVICVTLRFSDTHLAFWNFSHDLLVVK